MLLYIRVIIVTTIKTPVTRVEKKINELVNIQYYHKTLVVENQKQTKI